tara:strand:- start:1124 stop:1468 length:345 start_codon:yes stop_codon:yes gene_type:complete
MTNFNMNNLPPELQARIASIMSGNVPNEAANQVTAPVAPQQQAAPVVKQPSLMDHVIALRQEVAELRQQVAAMAQVTEAVGNATGQLYAMFQEQTQPTNFSSGFQEEQLTQDDY